MHPTSPATTQRHRAPQHDRGASVLVLPAALRRRLWSWSRARAPREACGLLLGTVAGTWIEAWDAVLASNLASGEDRFEVDPGEIVRAERMARSSGLELVGFWHSHPRGGAVPSAQDVRGAWAHHACVIVSLRDRPRIRAWRIVGGRLVEDVLAARPSCTRRDADHNRISTGHESGSTP